MKKLKIIALLLCTSIVASCEKEIPQPEKISKEKKVSDCRKCTGQWDDEDDE